MNDSIALSRRSAALLRGESGEVLIEAVIAFALFATVALGLGQQFAVIWAKLEHEKIATEVLLGPQESSMVFDDASGQFLPLTGATTPTLDSFLDRIGQFARSRGTPQTSFFVGLGYLQIDVKTGLTTGGIAPTVISSYMGSEAESCASGSTERLTTYAVQQLAAMENFSVSGQSVEVGVKLYDVKVGDTRYQSFVDLIPFVFLSACTEPVAQDIVSPTVSNYTIVPKRLVE